MQKLAPIILFVYNRPEHTRKTVEALLKNKEAQYSDLFVFADGCKSNEHAEAVNTVRNYIKTIKGFKSITIKEQDKNLGLAPSVIAGVTDIVNRFGEVIVVEDDLITSKFFLKFMNEALEMYKNEVKVSSIHGYMYPLDGEMQETYFVNDPGCWGWGTWARAWKFFEPDGEKLLNELSKYNLTYVFDYDGSYAYTEMLEDQVEGRVSSWAIRWYASAFLNNMVSLWPGHSLVKNIGMDGTGRHCGETNIFDVDLLIQPVKLTKNNPAEDKYLRPKFIAYFHSIKPSLIRRILHNVKRRFLKFINIFRITTHNTIYND